MKRGLFCICLVVVVVPSLAIAGFQLGKDPATAPSAQTEPDPYAGMQLNDPVAQLEGALESGRAKLIYDAARGYLPSLLKELHISPSSQTLVFSKTSFRRDLISPGRPRAVYFNDAVYIGWIPDSPVLEIASVDSRVGPVFYTLDQQDVTVPRIERDLTNCSMCHGRPASKLLMLSVFTDPEGNPYGSGSDAPFASGPFGKLFGGWYVTGLHGDQMHLGNVTLMPSHFTGDVNEFLARTRINLLPNVNDLAPQFDTKRYLEPGSDIVALLVLSHQIRVHNLMTRATEAIQAAVQKESSSNRMEDVIRTSAEPLVEALFFAESPRFYEPIKGSPAFADAFAASGPRDNHGRSLRDFDLEHGLFRYPLSYFVYSQELEDLPSGGREYVYRRIREILRGQDKSPKFSRIAEPDRDAIVGILRDTKPELVSFSK